MLYEIISLLHRFGDTAEFVVQQPEDPNSPDLEEQWMASVDCDDITYDGYGFTIEEAARSLLAELKNALGNG